MVISMVFSVRRPIMQPLLGVSVERDVPGIFAASITPDTSRVACSVSVVLIEILHCLAWKQVVILDTTFILGRFNNEMERMDSVLPVIIFRVAQ
jgi:hypothetical protein